MPSSTNVSNPIEKISTLEYHHFKIENQEEESIVPRENFPLILVFRIFRYRSQSRKEMSPTILHAESKRNSEATQLWKSAIEKGTKPYGTRASPCAISTVGGLSIPRLILSFSFFSSPSSRNLFIRRGERCLLLLARGGGGGGEGFPGRRGWEAETGQSAQEGGEWRKEPGRGGLISEHRRPSRLGDSSELDV